MRFRGLVDVLYKPWPANQNRFNRSIQIASAAEKASMQRNDSKEVNHILKPNQFQWHANLLNMFIMFTSLA